MSLIELKDGQMLGSKLIDTKSGGSKPKEGTALVSTASVDLDNDIIHQGKNDKGKGWVLDKFNKHGRILWGHEHHIPAIGKGKAYIDKFKGNDALHMAYVFDVDDEFAAGIAGKMERGFLDQWSVGFMTVGDKWAWRDDSDKWAGGVEIFEASLHEVSVVNVPANADSSTFAKSFLSANPNLVKDEHAENKEVEELRAELSFYRDELEARLKAIESAMSYSEEKNVEVIEAVQEMQSDENEVLGRLATALQRLTSDR